MIAALALLYSATTLTVARIVRGSSVAVASATLAVAAAFRPVRSRVRSAIDRRFDRTRYDAVQTLEAFGGRLTSQVDLAEIADGLSSSVRSALAPSDVSVWLDRRPQAVTFPGRSSHTTEAGWRHS